MEKGELTPETLYSVRKYPSRLCWWCVKPGSCGAGGAMLALQNYTMETAQKFQGYLEAGVLEAP